MYIFSLIFVLCIPLTSLIGCQRATPISSTRELDLKIKSSLKAYERSQSYEAWQTSDLYPEKIFSTLVDAVMENEISSVAICDSFSKLKTEDLLSFENEITDSKNEITIRNCKSNLINSLETYWSQQREQLKIDYQSDSFIRFPDTPIIQRNTRSGYFTFDGELEDRQVLLTFDDGPNGISTPNILTTLKRANVKALFFTLGVQSRMFPNLIQQEALAGHSIGSHSMRHRCLPFSNLCFHNNRGNKLTFEQAVQEISGGHQAVFDVLGWVDPFFRFPYGERSQPLSDYLAAHEVGEIKWNVDSEDWRKNMTPTLVIQNVMRQLKVVKHGIILFHDIQRRTAEALPTFLNVLYKEGYQPVIFQSSDPQARYNSKVVDQHPKP